MVEMVKVKAVSGRDTLMEDGHEWPTGAVLVEKTHYIRRRLADGDIVQEAWSGEIATGNGKELGAKKPVAEAAIKEGNAQEAWSGEATTGKGKK